MLAVRLPRFRARQQSRCGWIGIDIGTHSIKLAQIGRIDGQIQLMEASVIPLFAMHQLTVESLRAGWLTDLLKAELTRNRGFRGRTAACGISMNAMGFRSMSIPDGSTEERREMISQELSDSGESTESGLEFDFWDSSLNSPSAESPVNVLSISKSLACEIAKSIQNAGLDCQILDGAPFMLARSLELVDAINERGRPIAILDWGHRTTHLSIVAQGSPVFSRLLKDCAAGPLVQSLCDGLDVANEDAYELLINHGITSPHTSLAEQTDFQTLVTDLVARNVTSLIGEVQKTFSYLRSQRPELSPAALWLTGGGSSIRNIDTRLHNEIGIDVHRWTLPLRPDSISSVSEIPVEIIAQAASLSDLGRDQ